MAYAHRGEGALDYLPCRYGTSKVLFRGPKRDLDAPFVAVLGGTETYGKFVATPYPALVEEATGVPTVNLGCMNAGLDVFLHEPVVLEIASQARVTVVQVVGAQNLSNRYYAVHPRRNDRFVRASPLLRTIYREVDFTEFNFTRHMLQTLRAVSPSKFEVVAEELRAAWVARMTTLLDSIPGKTILLWMADHAPLPSGKPADIDHGPLLVDADMITAVKWRASEYVEVVSTPEARAAGREEMAYSDFDAPAAAESPGPGVHRDVARALALSLGRLF